MRINGMLSRMLLVVAAFCGASLFVELAAADDPAGGSEAVSRPDAGKGVPGSEGHRRKLVDDGPATTGPGLLFGPAPATQPPRETTVPPFGLVKRAEWTTSRVVGSPDPPLPYRLERAFPNLKFEQPVYMIPEPGSNRIFVAEYAGKIHTFVGRDENAADTAIFHDMGRNTYSLTFHPDYARNGYVFVFSNGPKSEAEPARHNRITRFQASAESPRNCLAESETTIIEWASNGHDGGDMAFGPDGCLYVTAGDGTSDSDTNNTGQDITDLPSAVLRIDVDHPDEGRNYGVPADNPFLNVAKARPEIWAFGFRNPWRMSFDEKTGDLWVGDVGQDLWELIHLVKRGGNYGWSVREGAHPFFPERTLGPAPVLPPIKEHPHSESRSITGGRVYYGSRLPDLHGAYIYCCYETGKVWGLRYQDGQITLHAELADSSYKVPTFGRDHAGELYLVAYSGEILRLQPTPPSDAAAHAFPRKLSETGIFASVPDRVPTPGVIGYSVNVPVWTDGAHLERLMGIPGAGQITMAASNGWEFPDGSVLAQTVSLEFESGIPESRRPIETRLLTRQDGLWQAYSYAWNDDATDADLVGAGGMDRRFSVRDAASPSGVQTRTWRYASRDECMMCHSRAANYVLGLSTLQMNKPHDYGGVVDNQLRAFAHVGLFDKPLERSPEELPGLPDPFDEAVAIESRARAYLHANCAHCHVMAGGGNAKMELGFATEREKTNLIDEAPLQGQFEIADARVVASGEPCRSLVLYRISKLGRGRMPHLGSNVVDRRAVKLFHDWIVALPPAAASDALASAPELQLARDALRTLEDCDADESARSRVTEPIDTLLSTTSGALMLLYSVLDGRFSDVTRETAIRKANAHESPAVRDLFEQFLPEEQRELRLGTDIDPAKILSIDGDAGRGERLFFESSGMQCRNCHQIRERGKELGPDLSHIAEKNDRAKLLESILDPSRTIDAKFAAYVLQTTAGRVHTGLLVDKSDKEVAIKDDQHNVIRVPLDEVDVLAAQQKSLMPDLLLRDMTAQQAADLLAYLETLK